MIDRPFFRHFVIEINCSFEEANSILWIESKCKQLINRFEIRIIKSTSHFFTPQGISLIYLISSSHMSIHTWPENNYIHIDFLTCDNNKVYDKMKPILKEIFPGKLIKHLELMY